MDISALDRDPGNGSNKVVDPGIWIKEAIRLRIKQIWINILEQRKVFFPLFRIPENIAFASF